MKHGSLFSGIGGFDLGFERAGIETVWQVEIDEYCRKVLARHFPHAQRFSDIRECGAHNLLPVDVLSGGFPCQDISNAGKRAGIDGERSGLWSEYARIIRELRPRYVVVENVAALLGRGMERVLGDLAACGYDAEWESVPAAFVGAPHIRERIWLLAYAQGEFRHVSETYGIWGKRGNGAEWQPRRQDFGVLPIRSSWALYQPAICGTDDGIPARVDRLRGLGNAIVPQIAEWIGRRIVSV